MKISDILDRWTILKMKARFDEDAKKELALYDESYYNLFKNNLGMAACLSTLIVELMEANAKIWENESAIRKEFANDPTSSQKLQLEEVGRRAIIIRNHNKMRIEAKTKIDKLFGNIPDNKVNHASQ